MDETFMVFSESGARDLADATRRFDWMLALTDELAFAKQAVIERSSGTIVGYAGVDYFEFDGESRLELGYRFVTEARGRGYATESARALLDVTRATWHGELLAFIDPANTGSRNVLGKLGFAFVEHAHIEGHDTEVYRLAV